MESPNIFPGVIVCKWSVNDDKCRLSRSDNVIEVFERDANIGKYVP